MNEIKFRYVFKNIFNDISIYYFTLKEIEDGIANKILDSGMRDNGYEIIAKDLFIDLKDKRGNEIYESDIILTSFNAKYEVKYMPPYWYPIGSYEMIGFEWEVIGNIYENPKLLKEN